MMQFSPPSPPRRKSENIVPMINVVFLLLIFFLMSAQIAVPPPVEVDLPSSTGEDAAERADTLFVTADGQLHYEAARGEAVFALIATREPSGPLLLRADAETPATVIAGVLPKLAAAGVSDTRLVTGRP